MANSTTTLTTLASTTTTTLLSTTVASSSSSSSTASTIASTISTLLSTTATTIGSTISQNQTNTDSCLQNNSSATCRLADFIRVLAYLILAVSLLPQILHLVHHGSRYIAGISYMWLITRVLGLASLFVAHAFKWPSIFEFIALLSTVAIFIQIFIYSDNLHRQQKVILITTTLSIWLVGGGIMLLLRKHENFLIMTGYLLLSVHMLPQILLNSLLRTAKSLSKFSILFLAMSDTLLFASFYTINARYTYLVTSYYAFSFFLFIYLQSLVYADSHIHLISRSAHTVLSPGVDIFTGLDANGARGSGQDPQLFSVDDLEPGDGTDVVYQPVTSNRASQPLSEQPLTKRVVWYATLSSVVGIEVVLTIMVVVRAWSPWIIFLPVSIPVILGVFYLLRMKLNVLQTEYLRKIL